MSEGARRADCDFCSRKGAELKRRYRGLRYCATCYAREFKARPCPRCYEVARLPISLPEALCAKCERQEPCTQCGKVDERRGRTTEEGRLCGPCARRLREAEPCELCGAPSNRLSRNARLGHDLRVCPKCQRMDHGTCQACGRHRPLEIGPDGRLACRPCREEGDKPCESCGRSMPAGYGRRCRECEGRERARRQIGELTAALKPPRIAARFASFGEWLVEQVDPEKAARNAPPSAAFFNEIGETWDDVPDYGALVAHFGAEGLRRQRRVMRWLADQGLIAIDPRAREDDSERRRIAATTKRLPAGSKVANILNEYHAALDERVEAGTLSLRSMRLALALAATLLEAAHAAGNDLPTQETLDRLMRRVPGQRAALTGFVRWLRDTQGIAIALPPKSKATPRKRRQAARAEMLSLLREEANGNELAERWRTAALVYFHDVTPKLARGVKEADVETDRDGLRITINGDGYWIPTPPPSPKRQSADQAAPPP